MSLPHELLIEFDKVIQRAGFTDRSKAIQMALHFFINEYNWNNKTQNKNGAGAIIMLYDNHSFNHEGVSTHIQHKFMDIISATTHLHLDHKNCLETIMVKGETKKIKDLARQLQETQKAKNVKVHFVTPM